MSFTATAATAVAAPIRRFRAAELTAGQALGLGMVGLVVAVAVLYPLLPGYDPYGQQLGDAFMSPFHSGAHPLGTDNLGRDTLSRLALGGRVTLSIVIGIIAVNALIGTVVGVVAGYAGGRTDGFLMGLSDIQLALPIILVLVALSAALGPSVWLMIGVVALTYWVGYARVARSVTLSLRGRDFVLSPRIQGARVNWILRTHIWPNVAGSMLILASTDVGTMIVYTASFDYLGLGVQAPTPSWGVMISEGQKYIRQAPWLILIPAITVFLVVAGTNLFSQRYTDESKLRIVAPTSPRGRRRSIRGPQR